MFLLKKGVKLFQKLNVLKEKRETGSSPVKFSKTCPCNELKSC